MVHEQNYTSNHSLRMTEMFFFFFQIEMPSDLCVYRSDSLTAPHNSEMPTKCHHGYTNTMSDEHFTLKTSGHIELRTVGEFVCRWSACRHISSIYKYRKAKQTDASYAKLASLYGVAAVAAEYHHKLLATRTMWIMKNTVLFSSRCWLDAASLPVFANGSRLWFPFVTIIFIAHFSCIKYRTQIINAVWSRSARARSFVYTACAVCLCSTTQNIVKDHDKMRMNKQEKRKKEKIPNQSQPWTERRCVLLLSECARVLFCIWHACNTQVYPVSIFTEQILTTIIYWF